MNAFEATAPATLPPVSMELYSARGNTALNTVVGCCCVASDCGGVFTGDAVVVGVVLKEGGDW